MSVRVSECGADYCLVMGNKMSKTASEEDGIHGKVFTGQHVVCKLIEGKKISGIVHKVNEKVSVNVPDITVCAPEECGSVCEAVSSWGRGWCCRSPATLGWTQKKKQNLCC